MGEALGGAREADLRWLRGSQPLLSPKMPNGWLISYYRIQPFFDLPIAPKY